MDDLQLTGLPVRAALHPTGLYLALRAIAPAELRDPFMQQTVKRLTVPEAFVQITPEDLRKTTPGTAPAGMIFHSGRCGSTLISQLLKKHAGLVVYAEPLPVSEILLPPHKWPRAQLVEALRALGGAFARHARGPYVLKFTSWNTLYCDLLAEAFPQTPFVFNYRDPIEVGVSLLKDPAGWFRGDTEPSRLLMKAVDPENRAQSQEDALALLYGAFCDAMARLDPAGGKLVPYEALPAAVWDVVAPHFVLALSADERQAMAEAAGAYSKAAVGQDTEFFSDSAAKQDAASAELRRAIETFARPALARLQVRHTDDAFA